MWWNKIISWFSNQKERKLVVDEFNRSARDAFVADIVPVYLKAEISRGNSSFKHAFSHFFLSGFRIRTMTGRYMSATEVEEVGQAVVSNQELTRKLVTLGFDTLEIMNPEGKKVKEWQLTSLLQIR